MNADPSDIFQLQTLSSDVVLNLLASGTIKIIDRFPWGSNYVFLTEIKKDGVTLTAVYKPARGERPLWDFARGTLAAREYAAYLISELLEWNIVPATVLREQGPLGYGSVQIYVDTDRHHHYFSFSEQEKEKLRPLAVFDLVINNADRKGGHILMGTDGQVWSIDHGISFHEEPKLRTVLWDFSDQAIPDSLLADLRRLHSSLGNLDSPHQELHELISASEFGALRKRTEHIIKSGQFPRPTSQRSYPWPLI